MVSVLQILLLAYFFNQDCNINPTWATKNTHIIASTGSRRGTTRSFRDYFSLQIIPSFPVKEKCVWESLRESQPVTAAVYYITYKTPKDKMKGMVNTIR